MSETYNKLTLNNGCLIEIEGLDKSGKSTCVRELKKRINNCVVIKFPDYNTESGKEIKDILTGIKKTDEKELQKLFSENRWEKYIEIKNYLKNNKIVILDRYIYSGIAYMDNINISLNDVVISNTDMKTCLSPSEQAKLHEESYNMLKSDSYLINPNLIFYLNTPFEVIKKRINDLKHKDMYENEKELMRVKKNFELFFNFKNWIILNDMDKYVKNIIKHLKKYDKTNKKTEIKYITIKSTSN